MIIDKRNKGKFGGKDFEYPSNHKLGMKVPEGGSMCGNCKFLSEDHKHCTNKEWIKWNNNKDKLPFKDEEYCCDLWEYGKKTEKVEKSESKEE